MPTLAMEVKQAVDAVFTPGILGDDVIIDNFMTLLDIKIHEAKDMLIERYNWIISQRPESASFMYDNGTMFGFDGKNIESAMQHGTLAIGQVALAETLQILIGEDQTTEKGMKIAKKIEKLFNDRCKEFKQEYKLNFGVYLTPKLLGLGVA